MASQCMFSEVRTGQHSYCLTSCRLLRKLTASPRLADESSLLILVPSRCCGPSHCMQPSAPPTSASVFLLCRITKEGVYNYTQMPRNKWIEKGLGMVTLSGSTIWWTWETEDVFARIQQGNKYAMKVCITTQHACNFPACAACWPWPLA